jgi:hypothetical protein
MRKRAVATFLVMPPSKYMVVYFVRTLIIWLAMHILSFRFEAFSFPMLLLALAVMLFLVIGDAERRGERRFLANLGVSRVALVGLPLSYFVVLEGGLKLGAGGLLP